MTHVAKQECAVGTWILADTGATHETVALMKSQRILANTRPGNLAAGNWTCCGWAFADGLVKIVTDAELPSISQYAESLLNVM